MSNIRKERIEQRKFGITIGIALCLVGVFLLWRDRAVYIYFLILAGPFIFLGLVLPGLLKPIYKLWMTLSLFLAWFMTRVILATLFFLVVTPIGLVAKLFGKSFLDTEYKKSAGSYWIMKKKVEFRREDYQRQF